MNEEDADDADEVASDAAIAGASKNDRKPNLASVGGIGAPMSYPAALARHRNHSVRLDALLAAGEKEHDTPLGQLWPNACQWLRSGKTSAHALTETHDSSKRAAALNKPGEKAFVGGDVAVPNAATYNASDLTDATGISTFPPGVAGLRKRGVYGVHIVEPAMQSKDEVRRHIVHEVQHDLDNPGTGDLERYLSEFRAYWITGELDSLSARKGSARSGAEARDGTPLDGFQNARQQAIFRHLYDHPDVYPYVKGLWADKEARGQILELAEPRGLNLIVSPRLERLYRIVHGDESVSVEDAMALIDTFTKEDAAAMQREGSRSQWEFWLRDGALPSEFMDYIRDRLGCGLWPPRSPRR